jgi:hypothetical protein
VRARRPAVWFYRRSRQRPRRTILALGGLTALAAVGAAAGIALSRETPRSGARNDVAATAAHAAPAIAAILKEFEDHPIVAIGESHDLAEAGSFYRALVRSPSFLERVDAVVVEFGNARYQSVVDAYVSGKWVSPARLRQVWQDTTQVGSWDAPMYAAFFAAVRKAHAKLPHARGLRVLLGDPPIEWSKVHSQSQWRAEAGRREAFMASVIEKQVLAKGNKALVIAGLAHLTHGGGGVSDLVESRHPGTVFVAAVHVGFPTEALERRLEPWPVPGLSELAGTWIGALPYAGRHAGDALDGLLYLGSPESLHLSVPLPTVYRDDGYWQELQTRFRIFNGRAFSAAALFAAYASPPYPTGYDPAEIRRARVFTRCMREHGIEAFPYPRAQFDAYGFFGKAVLDLQADPDFKPATRLCARSVLGLPPPF